MFKKVLIANRGEIAVRIIKACNNIGIKTIAIYPEVDEKSMHVEMADERYLLPTRRDYLNIGEIIKAAKEKGADAIHPGYGFLAENEEFSAICEKEGIVFIGPRSNAIKDMGVKTRARSLMKEGGVPVVPGSDPISDIEVAKKIAAEIGYPILIKASYGGGGRGIRAAANEEELSLQFSEAEKEASLAFGNGELYLEKLLIKPRHIEIQIIGDNYGNIIHLNERECSIQRRRQKLLEEAPSPIMNEDLRAKMGDAAVRAAKVVNYNSAGTVEFLVDKDLNFFFLEMNTRIQVEHPTTEMITGIDIVEEQIKVAAGETLSIKQQDVTINGWSIECRINAEDYEKNFKPSPGIIEKFETVLRPCVRLDTYIKEGYKVLPFFDSLIAKLIVWGPTREKAIETLEVALAELKIEGVKTTIPIFQSLIKNEKFKEGNFDNNFLENWMENEFLKEK